MTRKFFALTLALALLLGSTSLFHGTGVDTEYAASCSVSAYNPYHSGGYVYGQAHASCSGVVSYLTVTAQLAGPNGGSYTQYCYNVTWCDAYVNRTYVSGSWQTRATGLAPG